MKKHFAVLFLLGSLTTSRAQLPLLKTEGNFFVNSSTGEKLVLKGVNISNNVWGFWEWPLSDSLEQKGMNPLIRAKEQKPFVFTSDDVERISTLRGNVVRYCFNDELFRAGNSKRANNMIVLKSYIDQLAQKGIYSIVCMQINPGLDVQNEHYERNKPPHLRLQSVFESDSVFRLWRDTWQYVAKELMSVDAVVGYELFNEPKRPANSDASEEKLVGIYLEAIDSIRSVDNRHIVFVPEFNSREANPGETYWSETQNKFVIDQGEQGTIWGANWLRLPPNTPNLAYVSHFYDPYEFTSGGTSASFDPNEILKKIQQKAEWAYNENKPLIVSEYGVTSHHTMNGRDYKRMEWLKQVHDAFDSYHISSTFWQYKDLLTPWVKAEQTFGIWFHYYDQSTIKEIKNGKVVYANSQTEKAAIDSKVDLILHQYLVQTSTFDTISLVHNQTLWDELNRFFSTSVLSVRESTRSISPSLHCSKGTLYFKGLPRDYRLLPICIVDLTGRILAETEAPVSGGQAQFSFSGIRHPEYFIVRYGNGLQWTDKLVCP